MEHRDEPRISVVMCTYNGARFVEEQVASILAQTVAPHELVVGDDASSDDTLDIVRRVVDAGRADGTTSIELVVLPRDPEVRPQPYGVSANFARALEAATGDVVVLSDQDDRWMPDRVERSLAALEAHPDAGIVHGDARLVDAVGAPLGVTLFEALGVSELELQAIDAGAGFEVLLHRNLVTGATAAVRREVVETALPVPDGWIHDEWLAVVAGAIGRTAVIRDPLIDYRQHGANQIGARKLDWGTRWARLRESRGDRNDRLVRRARSLADRMADADSFDRGRLDAAREKLAHEEARAKLPPRHLSRVVPVWREWRTGRYGRYGLGAQDVLRDLVQPV